MTIYKRDVVNCKWCGTKTSMTGTKMCDRCYELDSLSEMYPELARRIIDHNTKHLTTRPEYIRILEES